MLHVPVRLTLPTPRDEGRGGVGESEGALERSRGCSKVLHSYLVGAGRICDGGRGNFIPLRVPQGYRGIRGERPLGSVHRGADVITPDLAGKLRIGWRAIWTRMGR